MLFWTEVVGVVGIVIGLIAGYLLRKSNARMNRETMELLAQRKAERETAEAAGDALAGRTPEGSGAAADAPQTRAHLLQPPRRDDDQAA